MIRPYEPRDLEALAEIGDRAWRPIHRMFRRRYGDALFDLLVPDERTAKGEQVRRHCQEHPDWVVVCEEDARVVGFATFWIGADARIGEIGNNAVDPDFQGRGLAQQLYEAVLERFRREGLLYAKVQTGLDAAHAPARRAYERAGFDIRHETVTYFQKL